MLLFIFIFLECKQNNNLTLINNLLIKITNFFKVTILSGTHCFREVSAIPEYDSEPGFQNTFYLVFFRFFFGEQVRRLGTEMLVYIMYKFCFYKMYNF